MIYRVKEKATGKTWMMFVTDNVCYCIATGYKKFIEPGRSGYSEYNDRGEPVKTSWITQDWNFSTGRD